MTVVLRQPKLAAEVAPEDELAGLLVDVLGHVAIGVITPVARYGQHHPVGTILLLYPNLHCHILVSTDLRITLPPVEARQNVGALDGSLAFSLLQRSQMRL
jgi:hypothetical protein